MLAEFVFPTSKEMGHPAEPRTLNPKPLHPLH